MIEAMSIEARPAGGPETAVECAVTLPTFRRPDHLLRTLESLERQRTRRRFAVIVVDNDAERLEGVTAASPFFAAGRLPGRVVLASERGNCHAYNAGWTTALAEYPEARFLLAIDDDECACEHWLESLVATAERTGADIVGGPQLPVFEGAGTSLWAHHPVFTPPYARTGPVPILYSSGNVAFRRHVLEAMGAPFLDPVFNFTGGGDSDLYARARRRGFRFAWSQEAVVHETTPERRTEFSWLQARSLRNGALSSIIEHRADGSFKGRTKTLAKSACLLLASPFRAARLGLSTRSAVIGLYPMNVAVGRFLAEFGRVNEQYRRPEQN
ncbi:glycosyltransferase family 2 protein [Aureimonas leprariae]|uniref:Glycosyltransferase family 2 protein n=1 Tax=Plantimonas leprariae TaxID=2615207 RepID=A0A7V7TX56_9HYPH|nr:glycosyltransferase [Aureimonas leprariae]KAB0680384.1 glycosyltransferase family 2 protein [Aureimonas leprariae]